MKTNQIDKLYSKLTPKEQACLVLEAAANMNESEADAVIAVVERKHYLCMHAEYTTHMQRLMAIIGIYGTEYWKNRALMLAACNLVDKSGDLDVAETTHRFYENAIALEVAVQKACNLLGVDVCAIRSIIGVIPNEMNDYKSEDVNQKIVQNYLKYLIAE